MPEEIHGAVKAEAEKLEKAGKKVLVLDYQGDPREAAKHFFADLRKADKQGIDTVLVHPVPELGIGIAVMDRMRKASGGNITRIGSNININ